MNIQSISLISQYTPLNMASLSDFVSKVNSRGITFVPKTEVSEILTNNSINPNIDQNSNMFLNDESKRKTMQKSNTTEDTTPPAPKGKKLGTILDIKI